MYMYNNIYNNFNPIGLLDLNRSSHPFRLFHSSISPETHPSTPLFLYSSLFLSLPTSAFPPPFSPFPLPSLSLPPLSLSVVRLPIALHHLPARLVELSQVMKNSQTAFSI